jgi:hypothetical protein
MVDCVAALAKRRNPKDSRNGRAIIAELERRKLRRASEVFVFISLKS